MMMTDETIRPPEIIPDHLTLADAEVMLDVYERYWFKHDGTCAPIFPSDLYPLRNNEHNAKRRTMGSLARRGVLEKCPGFPPGALVYVMRQRGFNALQAWVTRHGGQRPDEVGLDA